ncbi:hypothetical protein TRVA0_058S00254 [Trichomonascus vanleenenianus]|uniref:uncharacterized protein n=1 Tax=Trichomonascus vanleenenianus TaxID=2268995 RepID=UPI003ECAE7CF
MPDSHSTLCIPLKYTYLTRPVPGADQHVFFEALPVRESTIWRDADAHYESFDHLLDGKQVTDCLPALRKVVASINDDEVSRHVSARLNEERIMEHTLTVTLAGPPEEVTVDRTSVLRAFFEVARRSIAVDGTTVFEDVSSNRQQLNSRLCLGLDEIAEYCNVAVAVTDFVDKLPSPGIGYQDPSVVREDRVSSLAQTKSSSPCYILIYGDQDAIALADTRVRILLDDLSGRFVDSMPLDLSLQPLVCGPKKGNLKNVESQTDTVIYMPEWTPELFASQMAESDPQPPRNWNEIFISGQNSANVIVAKAMLKDILRRTKPILKDCVISYAKIDLLSLRSQNKIKDIMAKYGSFIQLPYLGAARSLVRVQGVTGLSVEKTIAELMALSTDFYQSSYWIHTGQPQEGGVLTQPMIDTDLEFLDKITAASGATIYCADNTSFDIVGFRSDTKRATSMIKSLPIWGNYQHQVRFRLELSIDQREFIAGKKNGKIIRIMNNANVWIKFLPFNEYNFYINLTADDYTAAAAGIQLLEDELPSEMSFYIPETYHKQVIGAGGSTIQSIMRKYNVFIKFSNGYDLHPNGFSHIRPDNVLVRCPTKNAKNIPSAKQELLETVQLRGQEHLNTFIHLSRSHRRILLSERCGFIHEVESKTNTIIMFPEEEADNVDQNDLIEIRGLGNTSEDASRMVKALLPEDYLFKIAFSNKFEEIVTETNPEFYAKIIAPFRIALNVETQVFAAPQDDGEGGARFHRIVLSFSQEHSVGLEDVIQALTAFLRDKDLDIIDRGEMRQDPVEAGTAAMGGGKQRRDKPFSRGSNGSSYDDYAMQPHSHSASKRYSPPYGEDRDDSYGDYRGRRPTTRGGTRSKTATPSRSMSRTRYSYDPYRLPPPPLPPHPSHQSYRHSSPPPPLPPPPSRHHQLPDYYRGERPPYADWRDEEHDQQRYGHPPPPLPPPPPPHHLPPRNNSSRRYDYRYY